MGVMIQCTQLLANVALRLGLCGPCPSVNRQAGHPKRDHRLVGKPQHISRKADARARAAGQAAQI